MKRIFVYLTFFTFLGLCSFELYEQHTQKDKSASQGIIAIRSLKKENVDNQDITKTQVETPKTLDYENLFSKHSK